MRAWLFLVALASTAGCARLFGLHDVSPAGDAGPPDAPPPSAWESGAAGAYHTCAIRAADHALYCWGRNEFGQLGLGLGAPPEEDQPTLVAPGPWSEVVASGNSTCARKPDNSVWCFGNNYDHQLGTGANSPNNIELAPIEISGQYTSVRLGLTIGCGLGTDQAVWCWGSSAYAFLGMQAPLLAPTRLAQGPYTALAVGRSHVCALAADGTLACWGANDWGQAAQQGNPVLSPGTVPGTWSAIFAAGDYTCAIVQADASLACWGYNANGQLGDMTVNPRGAPMPVQGAGTGAAWRSVELGEDSACGHTADGKTWCWGSNTFGQLAIPALDPLRMRTYASEVAGTFDGGFVGKIHTCLIAHDTHVMSCAGNAGGGQLADGASGSRVLPVHVADDIAQVSAGAYATCAVSMEGALSCWGSNHEGILGDGQGTGPLDRQLPTPVATAIAWQEVSLADHACGVDRNTAAYCWGANASGQTGDGTMGEHHAPVMVSASGWREVRAGINHSCGVGLDGGLWCWGLNSNGEGGQSWGAIGGQDYLQTLTRVGNASWAAVSGGNAYTCAIDATGKIQCFGTNGLGQLGDSAGGVRYTTAPTAPPITASAVSAGGAVACGIDLASTALSCWGYGPEGEIGDGTTQSHSSPVTIDLPATWSAISAGSEHTCGISTERTLYCWGKNRFGETGSGDFMEHHDPFQVGTDTDWDAVTTGYTHTCALKRDHTLWCWGDDRDGDVGDGGGWRSLLAPVLGGG